MRKRCVFKSLLKEVKDVAILSSRGRAFHMIHSQFSLPASSVQCMAIGMAWYGLLVLNFLVMYTVVERVVLLLGLVLG